MKNIFFTGYLLLSGLITSQQPSALSPAELNKLVNTKPAGVTLLFNQKKYYPLHIAVNSKTDPFKKRIDFSTDQNYDVSTQMISYFYNDSDQARQVIYSFNGEKEYKMLVQYLTTAGAQKKAHPKQMVPAVTYTLSDGNNFKITKVPGKYVVLIRNKYVTTD